MARTSLPYRITAQALQSRARAPRAARSISAARVVFAPRLAVGRPGS
ncbi:hypothetical protein SPHINGO361_110112 [Sphingomonas sp. EC-HK361]|nr:hypothetical protein SPHINGO361_110112 [Sphingomonas sp. EC-HK361]